MLTIRNLIQHARREIESAAKERIENEQLPLLAVESVTIEVNVVATESTEGGGGFDLKVITASGKNSFENQQVQKITVVLKAITNSSMALDMMGSHSAASVGDSMITPMDTPLSPTPRK